MVDEITVKDRDGDEFKAEVGLLSDQPVTPDNPVAKAVITTPVVNASQAVIDNASPNAEEQKELRKKTEAAVERLTEERKDSDNASERAKAAEAEQAEADKKAREEQEAADQKAAEEKASATKSTSTAKSTSGQKQS